MNKRGLSFLILALLAAACGGDSTEPEPTMATITSQSTAVPTATQEAVPTDPPASTATPQPSVPNATPQPPAPTALPTATQVLHPASQIDCPKRMHSHLNIESMRLQPGLTDAAITELDANTIRVELQGEEYKIIGWGDNITIGGSGDATGAFFDSLMSAVLAVVSDC